MVDDENDRPPDMKVCTYEDMETANNDFTSEETSEYGSSQKVR